MRSSPNRYQILEDECSQLEIVEMQVEENNNSSEKQKRRLPNSPVNDTDTRNQKRRLNEISYSKKSSNEVTSVLDDIENFTSPDNSSKMNYKLQPSLVDIHAPPSSANVKSTETHIQLTSNKTTLRKKKWQ